MHKPYRQKSHDADAAVGHEIETDEVDSTVERALN